MLLLLDSKAHKQPAWRDCIRFVLAICRRWCGEVER